jgi:hypothetical protein
MSGNFKKLGIACVLICGAVSFSHGQGTWSNVGTGLNAPGLCMAEYGGELYVGKLNLAGTDEINKWNGSAFSSVGGGTDGPVGAFLISANELIVGGGFTTAGGSAANDVAKWNGTGWTAIGAQMDNFCINALAIYNNELYAAGYNITALGSASAFTMAKWNGTSWVAVGSGLQGGGVFSMTVYKGELYASGTFTNAGNTSTPHIAKWNGTDWSAVGSGATGGTTVYTMAEYKGALYVGGDFSSVGGVTTNGIAKWNDTTWSKVGTSGNGTDNTVVALLNFNNELYVGGAFANVGSISANHIAKWNGSAWSALGGGVGVANNPTEQVWCIASYQNDIYVAGTFSTAGGMTASNIAKWTDPTAVSKLSNTLTEVSVFPNPLTKSSVIGLNCKVSQNVTIDIYDIQGKQVQHIFDGTLNPGECSYRIQGERLSGGSYILNVRSNAGVITQKLLVN